MMSTTDEDTPMNASDYDPSEHTANARGIAAGWSVIDMIFLGLMAL